MTLSIRGIPRSSIYNSMVSMVVPAFSAALTLAGIVVVVDNRFAMTLAVCSILAMGLLISWAMPAASPPTESIFSL